MTENLEAGGIFWGSGKLKWNFNKILQISISFKNVLNTENSTVN